VPSKFSIDDGAFYMSVDKLVEETGLATKEILRLTGRHLVETAIKVTPPHSGNMSVAHSEKPGLQKAQGLQNIRTDIQRVVGVLEHTDRHPKGGGCSQGVKTLPGPQDKKTD